MNSPFCLDPDVIYLNHAAVAPWPQAAREAVIAFADENARRGAQDYPRWLRTEQQLRQRLQHLIHAPSVEDIALLKSTSEGLSFIAYGLDWQSGDNIVIPAGEFPSNRMVWQTLADRGVTLREVDIQGAEPEAALIAAIDPHTRLLSCSSVQYSNGLRLDLPRLGEACRQSGTLFCVDAIQSLGALQFDVQHIQADFVVADGHKWMTGPEGLALFYCAREQRERLKLLEYGWHMMQHPHDFSQTDWQAANSAQRFECGSPNMLGAVALNAALGVLLDTGLAHIEQRVLQHSGWLIERLQQIPRVEVLTPPAAERRAGIVLFRVDGTDPERLWQRLMQGNIVCAARAQGVRFSPHFHNTEAQLDKAVQTLIDLL